MISYWYTRAQAVKAATKAFLINKVGDLFLTAGISFVLLVFYTSAIDPVNVLIGFAPREIAEIICAFFVIGVMGKSAQIGLHT